MIDLPTKAEVYCSDGVVGRSTCVIGKPDSFQLTHLVVKSYLPPFREHLVPVDQVEETYPDRIRLKCTRNDFEKMESFEYEEYIQTEVPAYIANSDGFAISGVNTEPVKTYIFVKRQSIPPGELALNRGARVEATDGTIGLVKELLINSNNNQVTHLVLLTATIFKRREITIPISQIDRVSEDTVILKLDRQTVEMLPTTPGERWPENDQYAGFERSSKLDKVLVVVFDSEIKAYEGSRALQELQDEGSISVYAKAVIFRDATGKVVVKQKGDIGPAGTAVGLLTGSLIGLIGGPVGLALGAGAGTFGGLVYDLAHLGVGEDFLREVEKNLKPGKAAIIAEVWEEWTVPVDTRMEALGGIVFRRVRRDVLDDQIEKDVASLRDDLAELEEECDRATGEARAKLQAKANAARARLQSAQDGLQARLESSKNETEAKIASLQKQAEKAHGEQKAKLETRITELKAEQKRRADQMKQAWEHTKETLGM